MRLERQSNGQKPKSPIVIPSEAKHPYTNNASLSNRIAPQMKDSEHKRATSGLRITK
jgi:hypothetical protein